MKPLYIFDLDGTLCDNSHRRHLIDHSNETGTSMVNWDAFSLSCINDVPIEAVVKTLELLSNSVLQTDILFFSGRGDIARDQTLDWLVKHCVYVIPGGLAYFAENSPTQARLYKDWFDSRLTMRRNGDYTPDEVLKASWYDDLLDVDKARLVAIFDDRDSVVKMWRAKGIACFQVAPGNF